MKHAWPHKTSHAELSRRPTRMLYASSDYKTDKHAIISDENMSLTTDRKENGNVKMIKMQNMENTGARTTSEDYRGSLNGGCSLIRKRTTNMHYERISKSISPSEWLSWQLSYFPL